MQRRSLAGLGFGDAPVMASSTTTMIPKAAATAADVVKDVVLVRYTPRDEGREGQGEGEERRVLFRKERRYQDMINLLVARLPLPPYVLDNRFPNSQRVVLTTTTWSTCHGLQIEIDESAYELVADVLDEIVVELRQDDASKFTDRHSLQGRQAEAGSSERERAKFRANEGANPITTMDEVATPVPPAAQLPPQEDHQPKPAPTAFSSVPHTPAKTAKRLPQRQTSKMRMGTGPTGATGHGSDTSVFGASAMFASALSISSATPLNAGGSDGFGAGAAVFGEGKGGTAVTRAPSNSVSNTVPRAARSGRQTAKGRAQNANNGPSSSGGYSNGPEESRTRAESAQPTPAIRRTGGGRTVQRSQQSAEEDDARFRVVVSGPRDRDRAEFMTRRRHPVKKVLAVACRTFGLDLEKARLYLMVSHYDEEGIVTGEVECNRESTMAEVGAEGDARLVVRVDGFESEETEEEEESGAETSVVIED